MRTLESAPPPPPPPPKTMAFGAGGPGRGGGSGGPGSVAGPRELPRALAPGGAPGPPRPSPPPAPAPEAPTAPAGGVYLLRPQIFRFTPGIALSYIAACAVSRV